MAASSFDKLGSLSWSDAAADTPAESVPGAAAKAATRSIFPDEFWQPPAAWADVVVNKPLMTKKARLFIQVSSWLAFIAFVLVKVEKFR
jgi:hypothetical protein